MEELTINYLKVKRQYRHYFVSFDHLNKINCLVAGELQKSLFQMVRNPRSHLVLNLSNINFIDSSGFSMLDLITRVSIIFGSTVTLIKVKKEVVELIELVRKFNGYSINYFEEGYAKPWQMAG